jgi:tape measure domain-containing protein
MASRFAIEAVFRAVDKITQPLNKMGASGKRFSRLIKTSFAKAVRAVDKFGRALKRVAGKVLKVGIAGGIAAAGYAITQFIRQASRIEDATAAFTPLLGSVDKAEQLVKRLNKEAATTPFQFAGIARVAKQLLPVMNGSIEDTANTFRMLGDTAGGNIQKLESITRGYTKALLKGKPDMESLNMIAESGVPIFTEMAKMMGISTEQLFEMSKQGRLTSDDLTKTFKQMTSQGGIFYKGMDIASKTLSGRWSTLKDNLALAAAEIGGVLLPIAKELVDELIVVAANVKEWVGNNKDLIKQKVYETVERITDGLRWLRDNGARIARIIEILAVAFIAYKVAMVAATIATAAFGSAMMLSGIGAVLITIGLIIKGIQWIIDNQDRLQAQVPKQGTEADVGNQLSTLDDGKNVYSFAGVQPSRSVSETKNTTEVRVTNDGTTDVKTDSGDIHPGGSILLPTSG